MKSDSPPVQRGLHRRITHLEQLGDLHDRMIEDVLENDAAALQRGQLDEAAQRRMNGFIAREPVIHRERVVDPVVGAGGIQRIAHSALVAAHLIDRLVVRDSEQPRPQLRDLLELRQRSVRARQGLLDDVLPVGDGPGHSRTEPVQFGADASDGVEEPFARRSELEQERISRGHFSTTIERAPMMRPLARNFAFAILQSRGRKPCLQRVRGGLDRHRGFIN
jgi:hypothetical protein